MNDWVHFEEVIKSCSHKLFKDLAKKELKMKVILIQDVQNLGKMGDNVNVISEILGI